MANVDAFESTEALVRPRTRAAEYVRMSTEHQKYSIANQREVIGRYRYKTLDPLVELTIPGSAVFNAVNAQAVVFSILLLSFGDCVFTAAAKSNAER